MFKKDSHPVVLAGGSGFLGQMFQKRFNDLGVATVTLTRNPRPGASNELHQDLEWDGKILGPWKDALEGASALINLTGKSVNCRYTEENRREILASRLDSVSVLGHALREVKNPPKIWLQASSLAIYGSPGDVVCTESTPAAVGFSPSVVIQWEEAFFAARVPESVRKVALRIGFALGRDGGALDMLARLTRWGLGGYAGSGKQYISWLHNEDLFRFARWAIENPESKGAYNVAAPRPVTNREFMRCLRNVLRRPWSPPVPSWAVKFGARYVLNTEAELALTGRRCVPERARAEGFKYEFTDLAAALKDIYGV